MCQSFRGTWMCHQNRYLQGIDFESKMKITFFILCPLAIQDELFRGSLTIS